MPIFQRFVKRNRKIKHPLHLTMEIITSNLNKVFEHIKFKKEKGFLSYDMFYKNFKIGYFHTRNYNYDFQIVIKNTIYSEYAEFEFNILEFCKESDYLVEKIDMFLHENTFFELELI